MSSDRPTLPPVRLPSDAELARDALVAPLLARAVRLARWAGPDTRVDADGELVEEQLPSAAEALGLAPDDDGAAYAGEAWRVAVDTGLVVVEEPQEDEHGGEGGAVEPGGQLALVTGGAPQDVLALWLDALETALADATAPLFDDLADAIGEDGDLDLESLDWDPQREAEFLDGVLANLYLLTVAEGGAGAAPVPLPALAASMIVPDDMGEPTDDVLEQVSEAMMRLDDQFRVLEPVGLVAYQPVDEALMAEEDEDPAPMGDDEDVSRYGMVKLTPLGLYGVRARMLEAGMDVPAVGDLADKGADTLLDGVAHYPEASARAETQEWLARREAVPAARELLAAAKGTDAGSPLRRLRCQQALSLVGAEAEEAVREVLGDPELGGLARVWLAERGAADVPAPPESMIFWLAIDTIAAQLDAAGGGDLEELQELVEGLTSQHSGFFDAAWRVEHPATPEVLEAMGRLHRDKHVAKEARKAAFKSRSRTGA
ncbi:hypothetical protein E2C00_14730 [Streptomyces sp. WAC05374]|uniref:hypothetical protein n=1 Tax=Streptomyces sp. WAC05374 TaxID=2487420 RepID=UPI000F861720|nr:hypothetical protein [Streptomyces sp. WAC05374]RST18715.1 hypothetical protein EF905_04470 [Streptomyces sp. WAC05374]TDF48330.1 hypothetical protein E2B92_05455 [Streptomyces sp. WAC05374]TDF49216.1 hypothetical protein E2C02_27055 [Streptomyces sp. WAC05374]TDF55264.1 hypothetical protein E2C00_14730 [Streptomyces sp. WAC05374]